MVSHPETSSDPSIGSDRESRRDKGQLPNLCFQVLQGSIGV